MTYCTWVSPAFGNVTPNSNGTLVAMLLVVSELLDK